MVDSLPPQAWEEARRLWRAAQNMLFITGAGISADSGLPTYRGQNGWYQSGVTSDGCTIEEALSSSMFRRRPEMTWKYLRQIAMSFAGKTWNPAHRAIAIWEQTRPRVWVLTQNVDGFHQAAGSHQVIEIHGHLRELFCKACGFRTPLTPASCAMELPYCQCGTILRPPIVLFEEALPEVAVNRWIQEWRHGFDLVVTVGTSHRFPYIVEPIAQAVRRGIPTVEINPDPQSELKSVVDLFLPAGAAAVLGALAADEGISL